MANTTCTYEGTLVYCGPRGMVPGYHFLYRNNGDGTFTDVSIPSGIAKFKGSYGLTAVAADFDHDGWQDIFVACNSTPSLLLMNNHDGTFREEGLDRGVASLAMVPSRQAWASGSATSLSTATPASSLPTSRLNPPASLATGKANFEDITQSSGIGSEKRFVSWEGAIADFDNDGLPDLF